MNYETKIVFDEKYAFQLPEQNAHYFVAIQKSPNLEIGTKTLQ